MSSGHGWQRLVGERIGPGYRLQALIRSEMRMASFSARREDDGGEVLITGVRCAGEECELYLRRFMEARFLGHPNVMAVLDAGQESMDGIDVAFAVTEPASVSLESSGRLDTRAIFSMCRDLLSGLAFLHSENFVYCALRADTTWLAGNVWKLGDFHQLRVAGTGRIPETRALMGRMPETPPEAFEGVVTPAWDVWSFGVTLAKILRRGQEERRGAVLPEPFESVVNRCLDPNPATRATVAELLEQFEPGPASAEQPVLAPAVSAPEPPRREPTERLRGWMMRRWIQFAIAGGVAGMGLTLLAIRHETPRAMGGGAGHPAAIQTTPHPSEPKPDPAQPEATQEADRLQSPNPEDRIRSLLETWVESTRERNVDMQVQCYAPTLDTFYGRHGLSARELRAEKSRQFSSIGRIRKFTVSDVRIRRINPNLAVVAFRKDWDFGSFAGSEQDEFVVRPVNGDWKISSERGRKLYWVRRAPRDETSG